MLQLTHLGKFKLPTLVGNKYTQYTFSYSSWPIAYRPKTDTLLIRGHDNYPDFAEVNIPAFDGTATVSRWFDPTNGQLAAYNALYPTQQMRTRAMYIDENDQAYGTISVWYNVTSTNYLTHFHSDLTTNVSHGMWTSGGHSLQAGGYICELSKTLKEKYNKNYGCGETIPQGTGTSHNGPSLYVYNNNTSLPNNGNLGATKIFGFLNKSPYPGWYPSWGINSMLCFPDHVAWFGRRCEGREWYGLPTDQGITDPCSNAKGYHAEKYTPVIFVCSNKSLLDGSNTFSQIDLTEYIKSPCAAICATIDQKGRVFVLESKGDGIKPLIHVFSFRSQTMLEEQITQLNQTIALLQSQIDGITGEYAQQIVSLQGQVDQYAEQVVLLQGQVDQLAAETEQIQPLKDKIASIKSQINALYASI